MDAAEVNGKISLSVTISGQGTPIQKVFSSPIMSVSVQLLIPLIHWMGSFQLAGRLRDSAAIAVDAGGNEWLTASSP